MNDPKSVFYDYTCQFYDKLLEVANEEVIRGAPVLVFRGSVVKVFRGMSISQSYYSKIRKALIDMGCTTVLQQGSRGSDTVVALHRPPTPEAWENISTEPLTPQLDLAILGQRVEDLLKLVGGIKVPSAIQELEGRLAEACAKVEVLEREVERLGRTPTAKRKSAG